MVSWSVDLEVRHDLSKASSGIANPSLRSGNIDFQNDVLTKEISEMTLDWVLQIFHVLMMKQMDSSHFPESNDNILRQFEAEAWLYLGISENSHAWDTQDLHQLSKPYPDQEHYGNSFGLKSSNFWCLDDGTIQFVSEF